MYNECRHIFTSGRKCQSPALKEQPFCYFHSNTRKRPSPANQPYDPYTDPKETVLPLPPLEEADAIQLALSDVILALAANRIDPRRARILIYGLQVASQNHRRRVPGACPERSRRVRGAEGAANVGLQDAAAIVRETHRHEDGTQIGPAQQSPDPEEIEEQRRPPSLGEILLREAEAMKAQAEAEREAQRKAAEAAEPVGITIPQIQAVADHSIKSQTTNDVILTLTLSATKRKGKDLLFASVSTKESTHISKRGECATFEKSCDDANDRLQREAAQLLRGEIEHGMLKSVRKATITEIWERLDFHSDRRQAAQDLT